MSIWKEIKYSLNSTLGSVNHTPIDVLIAQATGFGASQTIWEFDTPGDYAITIPYNCSQIKVTACGGGGGGAYGDMYTDSNGGFVAYGGGGGGGGAAIVDTVYAVTPMSTLGITVGSGGTGGSYNLDGALVWMTGGGATVIGDLVTLGGGKAGGRPSGGASGGTGGGAGGAGCNYYNSLRSQAQAGSNGISGSGGASGGSHSTNVYPGGGGGGSLGNGGKGASSISVHGGDGGRGAGGGGGSPMSRNYGYGGKGGNGYCKIEFILA